MIVVVMVGLLAVMARNAFQKYRMDNQDNRIRANAKLLAAAADEYYLENGVSTVALSALVGPTKKIKALNPVAGETYPESFTQGSPITITGVAGSRTVTYSP